MTRGTRARVLLSMGPRARRILRAYEGGQTFEEIGAEEGLCFMRVRAICLNCVRKLQAA